PSHREEWIGSETRLSRRTMLRSAAAGAAAAAVGGRIVLAADAAPAASDGPLRQAQDGPSIQKNRIAQTVCQWCFPKIPLEALCANAVRIGLRGIDLVAIEDLATVKKHNLVATTIKSHKIEKGLNRKENWDECLGLIRKGIEAGADAGSPNVICFSGN